MKMSNVEESVAAIPKARTYLKVVAEYTDEHPEIYFRIQMNKKLGSLKRRYAERVGVALTKLRFLFDGRRINDDETPKMLDMVNDDVIEVHLELTGGQ